MAFTTLVLAQLFNCFNARSDRTSAFHHLFTNRLLWGAIALSLLLQVAVVHLPFLNEAFDTTPLGARRLAHLPAWPASCCGPTRPRSWSSVAAAADHQVRRLAHVELFGQLWLGHLEVFERHVTGFETGVRLSQFSEHGHPTRGTSDGSGATALLRSTPFGELGAARSRRAFSRCCFWNLAWLTAATRSASPTLCSSEVAPCH